MKNTKSHRTKFDITLGNHTFCMKPTDKSVIC